MTQRLNYPHLAPAPFRRMSELSAAVRESSLGHTLIDLVEIRVSQLNGCAFCLDMHVKQAKLHGERELRLHHVAIWHESPLFSAQERAALLWAETLTRLPAEGVSDAVYDSVRAEFTETALAELTFAVMAINAWNRAGIAFRSVPGSADKLYGLDKAGMA